MLYKRGRRWWVRFSIRGREVRVSSGTDSRSLAEEFEQKLREQVWREQQFGQVAYTWDEACERWLRERAGKRSLVRDQQAFAALDPHLAGKALADITNDTLETCRDQLSVGRLPGTVRRLMAVALATLNAAVRWGWLPTAPRVKFPRQERHEPRWITHDDFERLATRLPAHQAAAARFAVATGLRQRNVYRLQWEACDLERRVVWIPASDAKGGKAISVPLSDEAAEVLAAQRGKHPVYVFTDQRGRAPIGSPKTAWAKATKAVGLEGFKWHDLRHTWASWHAMAGTPPVVLKELGGWASLAMVERYSHLSPGHLSLWANNSAVQKPAQPSRKRGKKRVKSSR